MPKKGNFYKPQDNGEKVTGIESIADGGRAISRYNKATGTTTITITHGFKETPSERIDRIKNAPESRVFESKKGNRTAKRRESIRRSYDGE